MARKKEEEKDSGISEIEAVSMARQRYDQLSEAEKEECAIRARKILESNNEHHSADWSEEFWAQMIRDVIVREIADAIRYGKRE